MSVFTSLAWKELTRLPHPVLNRGQCLNAVRRSHCRACQDICPEQVIGEQRQVKSWSRCTDCGRCVTACPTRAIGASERHLQRLLTLREGEEPLLLRCERSAGASEWGCLCELSWEGLAYLAGHRKLELDLSSCKACEREACRALLGEQLKQLHRVLGGFGARVRLLHRREELTEGQGTLSRRDLLLRTGKQSGELLKPLLRQAPLMGAEELHTDGLSLRKLVSSRCTQTGVDLCWEIPAVSEACTACGVCARDCPTHALRVDPEQHALLLESWRCVQCGTCATVCPNRAVQGYEPVKLRALGLVRLRTGQVRVCRDCGGALKPNSKAALCPACLRARMALAAQRSKRRGESD